MPETPTLTEAMAVIQRQYGSLLRANCDEGRRLMGGLLTEEFRISQGEARQLLDALEDAHSIRWTEASTGIIPQEQTGVNQPPVLRQAGIWQF